MVGVTDRNKSKADRTIGPRKKTWSGQKDVRRVFIGRYNLEFFLNKFLNLPPSFESLVWLIRQWELLKDAARVNEYFQEWCDVIVDVDEHIDKETQNDLIESQWDTIPFQILHSNQFEKRLNLGKFPCEPFSLTSIFSRFWSKEGRF